MPARRGCSLHRPVDRLVTTPQTVQIFIGQPAGPRDAGMVVARLTLVTVACRPFDITRIVSRGPASSLYAYGATPSGSGMWRPRWRTAGPARARRQSLGIARRRAARASSTPATLDVLF